MKKKKKKKSNNKKKFTLKRDEERNVGNRFVERGERMKNKKEIREETHK